MSYVKDLALELDEDFERCTLSSMEWRKSIWQEQVTDGRFEGVIDWTHTHIYWFDVYANVIMAKLTLKVMECGLSVLWDTATEQWCITTNYATIGWRD